MAWIWWIRGNREDVKNHWGPSLLYIFLLFSILLLSELHLTRPVRRATRETEQHTEGTWVPRMTSWSKAACLPWTFHLHSIMWETNKPLNKHYVRQISLLISLLLSHCYIGSPVLCCAMSFQSCPTLCDPTDCSPLGSSVHGILQARILEWVALPSSWWSSWPRDQTCVSSSSCIVGGFFTTEPPGKPLSLQYRQPIWWN